MKGRFQRKISLHKTRLWVGGGAAFLTFAFCLLPSAFCLSAPSSDIRAIVPPQPFYIQARGFWLVVAGVCLALVAVAWWFVLRRPKKVVVPTLTPLQVAVRRLRELEAQIGTMDARTFGGAVADVLRVYIGAQYGLHPERQTSEEFLSAIAGSRAFSVTEHSTLRDFLESCDLLKFARADATLEGKRRLLVQALDFLEGSASQPPPLAVAMASAI